MDFEEHHPKSTLTINIKKALSNKPWLYQKIPIIPIDPSQFVDYLGNYRSDELNTLYKVLLDGEQLFLKRGYSPTEALQPITRDLFIVGDMHFQFERNEQDRVYAFRLRVGQVKDIRFIKSKCPYMPKDFITFLEYSEKEIFALLDLSEKIHDQWGSKQLPHYLKGKSIALIWDAEGFRNRVAFELGIAAMGGIAIQIPGRLNEREID